MPRVSDLDLVENALHSCLRVYKGASYIKDFAKRIGTDIDRPSVFILMALSQRSLRFQDLVKHIGIEAPSISRKVHELENKGLVQSIEAQDRRVHMLSLTNEGKALTVKIKRAKRELIGDVLNDWSSEDRARLANLLMRLSLDLDKVANPSIVSRTK